VSFGSKRWRQSAEAAATKRGPDERVLAWLASLEQEAGVTSISVGELLTGVRALPVGRRREGLLEAIEATLRTFVGSVLAYDEAAARHHARLRELRRGPGRPLAVEDGMIVRTDANTVPAVCSRTRRGLVTAGSTANCSRELRHDLLGSAPPVVAGRTGLGSVTVSASGGRREWEVVDGNGTPAGAGLGVRDGSELVAEACRQLGEGCPGRRPGR
jgi:predicted nucleic acid-binding protein